MKAQDIYHKMRAIAEEHHAYTDQLTAIAKWIEAEFDYNPQKLANGANASERQLTIPAVRRSAMIWWNSLISGRKTQICDTHTELVGKVRRWETLTGREIQMLYESEHCA